MKALIHQQIQMQMNQAVECLNENQPRMAEVHFGECMTLCAALGLEMEQKNLQEKRPKTKQLTIDIP